MFNKVSYRRGVIEGVVLYTLGRLGALITPAFFPGWLFVAAPLLFLALQFLAGPLWATRRIQSTRRERLSKRFWLLGPRMAAICFGIDLFVSLTMGLAIYTFGIYILLFQEDTSYDHQHDGNCYQSCPGEQKAMHGIGLAVDGIKRAVIGIIVSE